MRVQIPCYLDNWMRGDRFGEVVKVVVKTRPGEINIDGVNEPWCKIAHVKLDKSGKIQRCLLSDCTEVV